MADTETGASQPPKNDASTTTPPADNGSAPNVEQLAKEQIEQRARQLANQIAAEKLKNIEEEAQRKKLEENEEYKTLAERLREENEQLKREQSDREKQKALAAAQKDVYAKFPKEVVEVAETAGLSLTDDTDDAKQQLEAKLKTIAEKVGQRRTPSGNNPAPQHNTSPERAEVLDGVRRGNPAAMRQAIGSIEALKVMRQIAGVEQVQQ